MASTENRSKHIHYLHSLECFPLLLTNKCMPDFLRILQIDLLTKQKKKSVIPAMRYPRSYTKIACLRGTLQLWQYNTKHSAM